MLFGTAAVVLVGGVWLYSRQPMPYVSLHRFETKMDIKLGNLKPGTSMYVINMVYKTKDGQEVKIQDALRPSCNNTWRVSSALPVNNWSLLQCYSLATLRPNNLADPCWYRNVETMLDQRQITLLVTTSAGNRFPFSWWQTQTSFILGGKQFQLHW
jgi:hypothetical protein